MNNAGQNFPGGKDEWDPEGYAASVAVNMLGPMRLTMGCHDKLKASTAAGGASVISIVSMSAFRLGGRRCPATARRRPAWSR